MYTNTIETIDYGFVPIRSNKNYIYDTLIDLIKLSDGDDAEIKRDTITQQLYAVILKEA